MKDKKDKMILMLILLITFMSAGFAILSNTLGNNNLETYMTLEGGNAEITRIVSVSTEGNAIDIKSYIKDNLTVVVYPKVEEKNDRITYTLNVKNKSKNDIELSSIIVTPKLGDHLLYTISNLKAGDVLEKGESRMFSVSINYNKEYELDRVDYQEEPIKIMLDFMKK